MSRYLKHIDTLNEIGIALSTEKDRNRLLEKIIEGAIQLTNADGGTLYIRGEKPELMFSVFINRSLNLKFSSTTPENMPKILFKPILLYDESGQPNLKNIVSSCILQNKTIHITNIYHSKVRFSGTLAMDEKLNYHSKSALAIPLRNHEGKILGALQLINAINEKTGKITTFSKEKIHLAESLASQAAITLTQQDLIAAEKNLFNSFIQLISQAIDEKSTYTSNHCTRVPIITMMIAEAMQNSTEVPFKDFFLTADEMEELRIAAWLHDCGKIAIPEHVMNKKTKLEMITDQIEMINLRIEILKRDLKIAFLEQKMGKHFECNQRLDENYKKNIEALDEAKELIEKCNQGGEILDSTHMKEIQRLSEIYYYVTSEGIKKPLLEEKDVINLSISRGTLNDEERKIIENHAKITLKMLSSLPYPENLKNVPTIAASHHERIDGMGYPQGIKSDQMLIQAKIIAIADIFEALTAADRPYKTPKKLSETLTLMAKMKRTGHIDADIFNFFIHEKIYLMYAKEFLPIEQIDAIDEETF